MIGWMAVAYGGAPSFDCAKASTDVERRICASAELSAADVAMSAAWKEAVAKKELATGLREAQRLWLGRRDGCAADACLLDLYQRHTDWLTRAKGWPTGSPTDPTGVYDDGSGNTLRLARWPDGRADFDLELVFGTHIGSAAGTITLADGRGEWRTADLPECVLAFVFTPDHVTIEQTGSDAQCGFGANVMADGTWRRTATTVAPFEPW